MRRTVSAVVVCVLAAGGAASAGPLSDSPGVRAIAVGESLRAAAQGALATTLNPAGLALMRSYVLEAAYGYKPEDKMSTLNIAVCDSVTSRVGACLSYEFLTADPSIEMGDGDAKMHQISLTSAIPIASSILIGITTRYVKYTETMSEETPVDTSRDWAFLGDAGLILRASESIALGVVGYNLVGADDGQFGRALGVGLAVNPMPQLLVAADLRYDFAHDSGRYGGGAEYFFTAQQGQTGLPIRAGYLYDSATNGSFLTAGLGYVTPRLAIDAGGRFQVAGVGNELLFQLGVRLFFPN